MPNRKLQEGTMGKKFRNARLNSLEKENRRLTLMLNLAAKHFNEDSVEELTSTLFTEDEKILKKNYKKCGCEIFQLDTVSALHVEHISHKLGYAACPIKLQRQQLYTWKDLADSMDAEMTDDPDSIWNQMLITNPCYNGPPIKLPDPGYIIEKTLKLRELESYA